MKKKETEKSEEIKDTPWSKTEELFLCPILCGENPKPPCYGEYPNCILRYRSVD